jgi:hypothetical protein
MVGILAWKVRGGPVSWLESWLGKSEKGLCHGWNPGLESQRRAWVMNNLTRKVRGGTVFMEILAWKVMRGPGSWISYN